MCDNPLTGNQKKYCSRKCHNKHIGNTSQNYESQQKRAITRKLILMEEKGRKCEICGQSLYFPIGSQYLTRPLPENTPIAESQLNQIILDEELYLRIKQRKWKKLNIEKLPVCNPKDGRPELI